ncbi:hypothetical protein KCP75_19740 [Salmonella enterica subsp. enterica]|nr:hypothetical protein KCP75_19740 [Salmonella enterica subsp. enterica]
MFSRNKCVTAKPALPRSVSVSCFILKRCDGWHAFHHRGLGTGRSCVVLKRAASPFAGFCCRWAAGGSRLPVAGWAHSGTARRGVGIKRADGARNWRPPGSCAVTRIRMVKAFGQSF